MLGNWNLFSTASYYAAWISAVASVGIGQAKEAVEIQAV